MSQKFTILLVEAGLVGTSYWILLGDGLSGLRAFGTNPSALRNCALFAFNLIVFTRFLATLFVFLKRSIPWDEAASISMAFALYLLGFPLMARAASVPWGAIEVVGVALFLGGSFLNTFSEWQRHRFKSDPNNRGKLYTDGLFGLSVHMNYFGDLLWVSGYACVTHNVYAALVPGLLFALFWFVNVPKLDAYLSERYAQDFAAYAKRTRKLIPFIL